MPGFTTHYLFGLNSFRELEEPDLVSCIRKFPHAFCMGLQGPDIFFYYLPSYLRSSGNIGQLAHHKNIWKQILMQSFLPTIRTVRHLNSTRVPPCTSAGRNGTSLLLYY